MIITNEYVTIEDTDFDWNNIMYVAKESDGYIVKFDNINGVFPFKLLSLEAKSKVMGWKRASDSQLYKLLTGNDNG